MLEREATQIRRQRHPIQTVAAVVGLAFLLVGALGFVPGVTTNYDALSIAGHHSGALLLGLFSVSILHNLVHLGFGVAGLVMARTPRTARMFLIYGGGVYLVLWLYGLVVNFDSAANFIPLNTADNWLHFGLAAVMISVGVALGRTLTAGGLPRDTEGLRDAGV